MNKNFSSKFILFLVWLSVPITCWIYSEEENSFFKLKEYEATVLKVSTILKSDANTGAPLYEIYLIGADVWSPAEERSFTTQVVIQDSPSNVSQEQIEKKYQKGQKVKVYLNPKHNGYAYFTRWIFPLTPAIGLSTALIFSYFFLSARVGRTQ
jgi:hypothetical protein